MASSLSITKELQVDHLVITAKIEPGSSLPKEIFVYTNSGTNELGEYIGVASLEEMLRTQVWNNTAIPVFGNKYLRHSSAKIVLAYTDDYQAVINNLTNSVKDLSKQYANSRSETIIVNIP